MNKLLAMPSIYISLPMLLACALTLVTYDLPPENLAGLWLLTAAALVILALGLCAGLRLPDRDRLRTRDYAGTRDGLVALLFAALIAGFCVLDLLLFPIPLFSEPSSYADMTGGRLHIRHVSDMCWVLAPIGILCARNKPLRWTLLGVAFVFPVLVIDRNRVFAAAFATGLVLVLRGGWGRLNPRWVVVLLAGGGLAAFAVLGIVRSGSLDFVSLPFSDFYRSCPAGIKWLLLYASAGPYNFSSILAKHYENPDFLATQLVPFATSVTPVATDIPFDAPNINVGSEYFPFLMAWGAAGALTAMLALYLLMLWSTRRLHPGWPLFPLLIFLRMSYVCVMAPFGPQAFTWTNFGFIAICLVLQLFAALLPTRLSSRVDALSTAC